MSHPLLTRTVSILPGRRLEHPCGPLCQACGMGLYNNLIEPHITEATGPQPRMCTCAVCGERLPVCARCKTKNPSHQTCRKLDYDTLEDRANNYFVRTQ